MLFKCESGKGREGKGREVIFHSGLKNARVD